MKITIERGVLLKVLAHIQGVVERRNTIPILSNVKFDAPDGQLSLNATDMDIDIVETVPADVASPGSTTAPAHTLYDIVRKLPEGAQVELDCTGDDSQLTLSAGRSKFKLTCLPTEDFPVLSGGDLPNSFTLSAADLRGIIDRTRFAISTEETRYYLNGVYLHVADAEGGKALRCVATDGHRLARIDAEMPEGASEMPGVIVPRKTVGELRKLLDDDEMEIAVSVSETKIRFATPAITLTSKVIDGTFPDYTRVIPQGNTRKMEVDAADFARAVDRVATVSSERSRAVKLQLDEDRLVLSVNAPDSGAAEEELAVAYADERLEIGFNAKYLLEIASQVDRENAVFLFNSSGDPTLMREGNDTSAVYVVMPMRV
ncbi:MAG TPA: DNA polymerase III subunit beta [Sulfitobacter sp.]|nr:DNA polymerase III subunit beta [Sulfitobacter sp.]